MSTHPQVGTQLGTDSHGCSYSRGPVVTCASPGAKAQVSPVRVRSVSPHSVDNPGGGAPCRPVDAAPVCAQRAPRERHRPPPREGARAWVPSTVSAPACGGEEDGSCYFLSASAST